MDIISVILIIAGLCLFETITSIDNAIITAEVLSTMNGRGDGFWYGDSSLRYSRSAACCPG